LRFEAWEKTLMRENEGVIRREKVAVFTERKRERGSLAYGRKKTALLTSRENGTEQRGGRR